MNRETFDDRIIELGDASVETRGGAMGYEDTEGTLWVHGGGLSAD